MWFFYSDFFSGGTIPSILIRVECGVEPFTLAVGLWMVWTGLYFLHTHHLTEVSHQQPYRGHFTEVSHQLTLKVTALV